MYLITKTAAEMLKLTFYFTFAITMLVSIFQFTSY